MSFEAKPCARCKKAPRKDRTYCGPCRTHMSHRHYVTNKPAYAARAALSRERDPEGHNRRVRAYYASPKGRTKRKQYLLQHEYGLTVAQYEEMLRAQAGLCAICGRAEKLHVDHDHNNGRVRGLLCGSCNKGIGLLQDAPGVLRAAAFYLER